ncbi:SGNH/GDSL hydrolase family protein [Spirillospora sp. NPDC127200]
MRWKKALGSGTAALALVAAACTGTAAAVERAPQRYVALGDSFVAGPLIPNLHGTPVGCLRSDRNYPSLVAARLGAALTDVSCSGAETVDMAAPQVTPLGTNPPQVSAVTAGTDLVTLSIGGNDIGFGEITVTCGLLSIADPVGAPCAARYGDTLDRRVAETAPKVGAVLREVRARAPQARILVVGYLRLMPERPGCWPLAPVAQGDLVFLDGLQRSLNGMMARQAEANGAGFVDAYEGGLGHDMCAAPDRKWVEGIVLTAPAAPVHPNAAGMREVADRVAAVLEAGRDT